MTLRPTTYGEIMQKFIVDENLEMALQLLKTMSSEKLAPTLETMTSLISLAAEGGHPRLALDLVASFEAATRSLPPEVWVRCLQSSARELYVSPFFRNSELLLLINIINRRRARSTHGTK